MQTENPQAPTPPAPRRKRPWALWAIAFTVLVIWAGWYIYSRFHTQHLLPPAAPSFVGSSTELKRTVFIPTLDTPMAEGKNVVWCASFQMAWNHLCSDVFKGPVTLVGAESVTALLNASPTGREGDMPPDGYFAAAGTVRDGILNRIHDGMARFPDAPMPDLKGNPEDIVAFGYLNGEVRFDAPFFIEPGMTFTDSSGQKTSVNAFGLEPREEGWNYKVRNQVAILYINGDGFILDLCRTSNPSQVVIANIPRKATLAATVADAEAKIAQQANTQSLDPEDTLEVPFSAWRVTHHFSELEGKAFPGLPDRYMLSAEQMIDFRFDRYGAAVESSTELRTTKAAQPYPLRLDHPFLIYMKKRGATQPYFSMWVDNAELLTPAGGAH